MMWFYWGLVPIQEAEEHARIVMGNFDQLPRGHRDKLNYATTVNANARRGKKKKSRR
jgi:hypothetical protein